MTTEALNKSDLIERIALKNPHLAEPLVEEAVKIMSSSGWVVLRGFLTKFIENMWEGVVGCMALSARIPSLCGGTRSR